MKYATTISKQIRALAQVVLVLTPVAACTPTSYLPPCPNVFALADARQFDRFRSGGKGTADIDFAVKLDEWSGSCSYKQNGEVWDVTVDVVPTFIVKRGPANANGGAQYQYFAAIPALFPKPEGKQTAWATIQFPEGVNTVQVVGDALEVTFPIRSNEVVDAYTVYLGLQMTPEEIARNRRDK